MQFYECGESPFRFRIKRHDRFVRIGEFRKPKQGEWYLSGAIPEAWYAPNDLGTEFHILRRVETKQIRILA